MTPDLEMVKLAAQQGGGYVLAIVVLAFYRLDHLKKQKGLREAHERRDAREENLLEIIERQATASEALVRMIEQLDATLTEHHRIETAWGERLGVQVDTVPGKIRHELAPLFEQVLWRDRDRKTP